MSFVMRHYDYGVSAEIFCAAWQLSSSMTEAYRRLADVSRAIGRRPMPKAIMQARASKYRKKGVALKRFPPGPAAGRSVYERLKVLLAQINSGEITEVPFPARSSDDVRTPTPPDPE